MKEALVTHSSLLAKLGESNENLYNQMETLKQHVNMRPEVRCK